MEKPKEIKPRKLLIKKEVSVKGYTKKDGTIVTPFHAERLTNPNKEHIQYELPSSQHLNGTENKLIQQENGSFKSEHSGIVYDSDPQTWDITKNDVNDMLTRNYNRLRNESDFYNNKNEFINEDPYHLSLILDSDSETYQRYLKNLPENIGALDVIHAYRENLLPLTKKEKEKTQPINITDKIKTKIQDRIGEPHIKNALKQDEAKDLYQLASQKRTSKNRDTIDDARYKIFMDHMLTPDLHTKLGIEKKELNLKIKSWTGMTKEGADLQRSFNEGVTTPIQWTGIENSSFLSRQRIQPNDLDHFFKHIDTKEGSGWNTPNGEMLRNYIARTILGIDTRINYSDLTFHIDDTLKPNGMYSSIDKSIKIRKNSKNTVAHEIGHYLDNKWGMESGMGKFTFATSLMDSINKDFLRKNTSDLRVQWHQRFDEFTKNLSNKGDIQSEYTQDRKEVFARFVDKFVSWTNKKSGMREMNENSYYNDKFGENDFRHFVRLLQEKSYVDIADKNKFGIKKIRNVKK